MKADTSRTLCEIFAKAAGEPPSKGINVTLGWLRSRMERADALVVEKLLSLNRVIDADGITPENLSNALVDYINARRRCAEVTEEYYELEKGKEK